MKLEVGMYVRTKEGIIAKCIYVNKEYCFGCIGYGFDKNVYKKSSNLSNYGIEETITKHSKDIIDLIEVGDYVNGHKVIEMSNDGEITTDYSIDCTYADCDYDDNWIVAGDYENEILHNEDIKEILTHEQYNSNKYVIGDDKNE